MHQIGSEISDLKKLDPEFNWCVVLEKNTDITGISSERYTIETNMFGGFVVTAKPRSFFSYVKNILKELKNYPGEDVTVKSFGNEKSERASIHRASSDLEMKVKCSKSKEQGCFVVSYLKNGEPNKPVWFSKLVKDKPIKVKFEGLFSNFRASVYRCASSNDVRVKVSCPENNTCELTLVGTRDKLKSNMTLVNDFLDAIPQGESLELPESLSSVSDNYIRVLCSKHENDLSFTKGKVNHHTNGPRIDSKKNFIYNGRNFGKREPAFIRLKLNNTEYDAEQFIKENTK